jgi:hypothetical protein
MLGGEAKEEFEKNNKEYQDYIQKRLGELKKQGIEFMDSETRIGEKTKETV